MRRFTIILSVLVINCSVVWSQHNPRLLEIPDLTEVQKSDINQINKNILAYDPIAGDIINQTNLDSLVSYVRILSGEDPVWIDNKRVYIRSRGGTGGNMAATYIKQKLSSFNLEVHEQNFSSTGKNVYAVQEGYLYPEKTYIICAHYDAVNIYSADDNASGVATVLEAARILSQYATKYTLVYALWDESENWLSGSDHYASMASSNREQIQGVINLDMLGWDGNNDGLADIHSENTAISNEIANRFLILNWLYGLPLNPVIYNPGSWAGDHSSFWSRGFGAVMFMQAYYGNDLNPYYATFNDRIDKFNLPYFHNMSKLAIGVVTSFVEALNDTILASVTPDVGYQTYPSTVQIKGVRTHFHSGEGTEKVWLSKRLETIAADSFSVISNTLLNAYFQVPGSASAGVWYVNVQTQLDGIVTKEYGFTILPPPAVIVVQPDSIVVGVLPGSTKTQTLTINNQGETDLKFNVTGGFSSTNYALEFNGIDGYVLLVEAMQLGLINQSFTVESWINITDFDGGDEPVIAAIEWCSLHFVIRDEKPYLAFWGNDMHGNTTLTEGNWYHVAWRYDLSNGEQAIILNGKLDKSETGHQAYQENTDLTLGNWENYDFFTGIIDDFRIWDYVRSEKDIKEDMYRQLSGSENGLISYWNFNEGSGEKIYDKTINSHNGTLIGGVNWVVSSAPLIPGWFQVYQDYGVCSPNSSVNIELLLDATELDSGNYHASIVIHSSDPFAPSIVVPIHMIVSTAVGVDSKSEFPVVFDIQQNYPNPFNPNTVISYRLPESGDVKLRVFDLLGRAVAMLVDEYKTAGNYEVIFDASHLPSGLYFYQLQTGSFLGTKKMVLMK